MVRRKSRLIELRALSDEDFKKKLDSFEYQYEFAYEYCVSTGSLSKEINIREIKETLLLFNIKSEDNMPSKDAWKNSKERHSFVEAGLMTNVPMINK